MNFERIPAEQEPLSSLSNPNIAPAEDGIETLDDILALREKQQAKDEIEKSLHKRSHKDHGGLKKTAKNRSLIERFFCLHSLELSDLSALGKPMNRLTTSSALSPNYAKQSASGWQ